ncbi:MAG: hypothetical protein IPI27_12155 [Betaproteobacteria bacterium]|nr:hypothetical protein [Betaproteobacteria bacterium]
MVTTSRISDKGAGDGRIAAVLIDELGVDLAGQYAVVLADDHWRAEI